MRLERIALAVLIGGIVGFALKTYLDSQEPDEEDPLDWMAEWTIEVPPEHLRDETLLMQEPIYEDF